MHDAIRQFQDRNFEMIHGMAADARFRETTRCWFEQATRHEYSYHFSWLGRPIIQYPQDIVAMQELVWEVKPDVILETGIAHGGSLILYASLLSLLGGDRRVIGVDIEIRPHNREAIETHFLFKHITLIEGSSIDERVVRSVCDAIGSGHRVLVVLDSNHTHEHVLKELEAYSPLVKSGSYVVVFDTVIADLPADCIGNRPWTRDRNPKTAVHEFLSMNDRFEIDEAITNRLGITVAPSGYLRCIKD